MKSLSKNKIIGSWCSFILRQYKELTWALFVVLYLIVYSVTIFAAENKIPKIVIRDGCFFQESPATNRFFQLGINYFRPGTGWAPKVWQRFDAEQVRNDFGLMKSLGVNCVRIFLTFGSFFSTPNQLDNNGIDKFETLLDIAEDHGIYIHPTGPDHWEGTPKWLKGDPYASEAWLSAREKFWQLFATRFKERNVIFAYDLLNEPSVGWDGEEMGRRWNQWLVDRYGGLGKVAEAWKLDQLSVSQTITIPDPVKEKNKQSLVDYQHFRESIATEWIKRQVNAIRSSDPKALVTVGLIQWSIPVLLPQVKAYSGFCPQKIAPYLDFMEIHFYPLAKGFYSYESLDAKRQNLAYLNSVVELAKVGKPVVLAEFGWYGGGKLTIDDGRHPIASEEEQAQWCEDAVRTTAGLASGWLNWGLYDHPEARDVTQLTGLLTSSGQIKVWGKRFKVISTELGQITNRSSTPNPSFDWDRALIDLDYMEQHRKRFWK